VPTSGIRETTSHLRSKEVSLKGPPLPVAFPDALVSLNIISSGDVLPLVGQEEVTLGRVSEGQPVVPDIDLTPYKAYEAGVSRMHASIRMVEDQVLITDLGSANGTRVNGLQITPHIPYPMKHGDILTLGKFKIQILLRNR
jgi:pSer/pThr/pTyr-binding forkhead associated (FHA) protein